MIPEVTPEDLARAGFDISGFNDIAVDKIETAIAFLRQELVSRGRLLEQEIADGYIIERAFKAVVVDIAGNATLAVKNQQLGLDGVVSEQAGQFSVNYGQNPRPLSTFVKRSHLEQLGISSQQYGRLEV